MNHENRIPPWVWLVSGCATVIVLAVVGAIAAGYFGYRQAKQVVDDMKDPVVRARKVKSVLGCEQFPAGYNPVMALSIPLVMDVAVIADGQPTEDGAPAHDSKRGFFYLSVPMGATQAQDLKDFFDGKRSSSEVLDGQHIRFDRHNIVGRGAVSVSDAAVSYLVTRGDLEMHSRHQRSLTTMLRIECPGSNRTVLGLWFVPDPAPGAPLGSTDLTGTPGDETALKDFLAFFRLCRK